MTSEMEKASHDFRENIDSMHMSENECKANSGRAALHGRLKRYGDELQRRSPPSSGLRSTSRGREKKQCDVHSPQEASVKERTLYFAFPLIKFPHSSIRSSFQFHNKSPE